MLVLFSVFFVFLFIALYNRLVFRTKLTASPLYVQPCKLTESRGSQNARNQTQYKSSSDSTHRANCCHLNTGLNIRVDKLTIQTFIFARDDVARAWNDVVSKCHVHVARRRREADRHVSRRRSFQTCFLFHARLRLHFLLSGVFCTNNTRVLHQLGWPDKEGLSANVSLRSNCKKLRRRNRKSEAKFTELDEDCSRIGQWRRSGNWTKITSHLAIASRWYLASYNSRSRVQSVCYVTLHTQSRKTSQKRWVVCSQ